jgi:hypothetical protein
LQDKSESTRKAYRADFAAFVAWCSTRGVEAMPATPETGAAFLESETFPNDVWVQSLLPRAVRFRHGVERG